MIRKSQLLVLAGLLIVCSGCDKDESSAGKTAVSSPTALTEIENTSTELLETNTSKTTLLFFINPRGNPCIMQDGIIKSIAPQIDGIADVVYVKTNVAEDRKVFHKYGIRSLPCLILTKADGEVIKRFSPGVQDSRTILEALKSLDH